jgi:hypothetical protein
MLDLSTLVSRIKGVGFHLTLFQLHKFRVHFASKSIYARLVNNSRRTFEQTCGQGPENKPADMRQIGHTARLYLRDSTRMHELGQEPKPNQERGRNQRDAHEYKKEQYRLNPIARIGHNEPAHYCCDGSTRAQVWNRRMRIGQNLGKHGHQTSGEIEEEVSAAAHRVFDLRAEGPQENHVPDDVRPTAMHEHRSEDGDPVMAGNDLRRNRGPLHDECVTASRGIAKGNQASQLSLPSLQAMFAQKHGVQSHYRATRPRDVSQQSAETDSTGAWHFEPIFVDFETLDLRIERSRGQA